MSRTASMVPLMADHSRWVLVYFAVGVSVLATHPPNQITIMENEMKQATAVWQACSMCQTSLNANLLMRKMQRMDCHRKRR
jgi:hypothetical protein